MFHSSTNCAPWFCSEGNGSWDESAACVLQKSVVRALLAGHVDVVRRRDVDLAAVDDVDEAAAAANELGFFASGLILHGADGHDHLRLQLLDSTEIELDDIVCDSAVRAGTA